MRHSLCDVLANTGIQEWVPQTHLVDLIDVVWDKNDHMMLQERPTNSSQNVVCLRKNVQTLQRPCNVAFSKLDINRR